MSNAPTGYTTPKTNWVTSDPIFTTDLNRVEGNTSAIELGNRTIDQDLATPGNVGTLRQVLSWFAGRLRAITGAANWFDTPATTLTTAHAHHGAAAPVHGSTAAATAGTIIQRDAAGRAQVAAPAVAADIARLDTVTAHTGLTNNPHSVTAVQIGASPINHEVGIWLAASSLGSDSRNPDESWQIFKEVLCGRGGTYRITFTLSAGSGATSWGVIRRNGVDIGTIRSVSNGTGTWVEDIAGWATGDLCQIWGRNTAGVFSVSNFQIRVARSDMFITTVGTA